jgi:hypothetical protein
MATDRSELSQEYLEARNILLARATIPATGIDALFVDWYRLQDASSRCAQPGPAESFTFGDFVEQVIRARISKTPLPMSGW